MEPATEAGSGTVAGGLPARPGTHIGPYRLIRPIGAGAMGCVYLAEQDAPRREVALKIVSGLGGALVERMRREIAVLARLEHPGIARLYAAGGTRAEDADLPWLAMEYVDGPTLTAHADRIGADLETRLQLAVAVARAAHYAHGLGIVHRDLKPANILVDALGQPKILDFGIALLRDEQHGLTRTGQVLGTLPYMAPEQLAGDGDGHGLDVRCDVYALGVLAYELLTGRLPHPRLATATLFEAIDVLRGQPPVAIQSLLPKARGDLGTVIMKAIAADPAQRYASAAAFADDLERILAHRPIAARRPSAAYRLTRFVRRHRAASAAAAAIALCLIGATAVSLRYGWSEAAARREAELRAAEADATRAFLETMLVSADPEQALGRELRIGDVLDEAVRGLNVDTLPPAVAARLRRTLGRTYLQLGDAERGATLLRDAAALADPAQPLAIDIAIDLARADQARGARAEARGALDDLLAGDAPTPAQRLAAGLALSEVQAAQGQAAEAERGLRALIAAQPDADPAQALTARHNLAAVLQQQGRLDEALAIAEDVLARRIAQFGDDHPQTLYSRNQIASLHQQRGEPEQAEAMFRAVLEARRRVLGPHHPATLTTERNLAVSLVQNGRPGEAEPLLREVAAQWAALRGETDPRTLETRTMLAFALTDLGRRDEAERLLREVIARQDASARAATPETLTPRNDLAMLLMDAGRLDEALAEFDRIEPVMRATLGDDHLYVAILTGNRGQCLARLGRLDAARSALEASHARLLAALGAEHPRTRKVAAHLAEVRHRLGVETPA